MVKTRHAASETDQNKIHIRHTRRHPYLGMLNGHSDHEDESSLEVNVASRHRTSNNVSKELKHEKSDIESDDFETHRNTHTKSVRISERAHSQRTSPRRTYLRKPKLYLDSDDDEEEISYRRLERGRTERISPGRRQQRISTPLSAPADNRSLRRTSRQHCHYNEQEETVGDEEDQDDQHNDEGSGQRRSGRQRKLIYDTFNQRLIDMMNHHEPHNEDSNKDDSIEEPSESTEPPARKRRRREIDLPPPDEVEMHLPPRRTRKQVKRDMYGIPVTEEEEIEEGAEEEQEGDEEEDEDGEPEEEESGEEQPKGRSYALREHRTRTQVYEINWEQGKRKKHDLGRFREQTPTPRRKKVGSSSLYRSPARRKSSYRKRKAAFHGNSSTSSSGSSSGGDSSDDERRFERRKAKSMAKSRQRCLPMNLTSSDVASGALRDRSRIGASLADIDPMNVDRAVTFESVGGLGKHIHKLKEMIVFPLLYPEVFEKFKIQPPRGVLFYGPPGTGKTLVARALANECSTGERRVAFFMRKGADCLSKWVGESERQLRLLFDQAYQMRPSIIFFDEIDGLAPVRSSRQDQIHSSIVSTLLALMDGLDSRGEIVVIGATNRLDSIDPALRRPGRFDREFLFPLPSVEARKQILQIHTSAWNPALLEPFLAELADKCTGYCGADLKALCTEAALSALRRRYPQIYSSADKLQLDVSSIHVSARDFHHAMQAIVPTAQRSLACAGYPLSHVVKPLLDNVLDTTMTFLHRVFPTVLAKIASNDLPAEDEWLASDSDDDRPEIVATSGGGGRGRGGRWRSEGDGVVAGGAAADCGSFLSFTTHACQRPLTHRPRLLLAGACGQGQSSHMGPAVLHRLERVPVHILDLAALYGVSAHAPEEACAQILREARRSAPSVLYVPRLNSLWAALNDSCRATFQTLLRDLQPSAPLLLLATSDTVYDFLPEELQDLFSIGAGEVVVMQNPTDSARRQFFQDLLLHQTTRPPPSRRKAAARALESLPVAPAPPPRELTASEVARLRKAEDASLRELRLFLRDVLNKLGRDRKFHIFTKPVDVDDAPDYYDIITQPMDLSTMMSKIDLGAYETVADFLENIELITRNALEYNPNDTLVGRAIRHRACALRDLALATIEQELDMDFEKQCQEIQKARRERGESKKAQIPDYYFTKPLKESEVKALRLNPSGLQVIPEANADRQRSLSESREAEERGLRRSGRQRGGQPTSVLDISREDTAEEEGGAHETAQHVVYEEIHGVRYKVIKRKERQIKRSKPAKSPFFGSKKSRFIYTTYYIDEKGREFTRQELKPIDETVEDGSSVATTSCASSNIKSAPPRKSSDAIYTMDKAVKGEMLESLTTKDEQSRRSLTKELSIDIVACTVDQESGSKHSNTKTDGLKVEKKESEKENMPSPRPSRRSSMSEGEGHSPRTIRSRSEGHLSPHGSPRSPRTASSSHQSRRTDLSTRSREIKLRPRLHDQDKVATESQSGRLTQSRSPPGGGNPRVSQGERSPRRRSGSPRVQKQTASLHSEKEDLLNTHLNKKDTNVENEQSVSETKETVGKENNKTTPKKSVKEETIIQGNSSGKSTEVLNTQSVQNEMEVSPVPTKSSPTKNSPIKASETSAVESSAIATTTQKVVDTIKQENMETEEINITAEQNAEATLTESVAPRRRVTRSQAHSIGGRQMAHALALLEEPPRPVVVDKERLQRLLDLVVAKTSRYNVELLERLYALLSQCVFHHRLEHDKTHLLQELESCVKQFLESHCRV